MVPLFRIRIKTLKLKSISCSNLIDIIFLTNSDQHNKLKPLMFECFIMINEKSNQNFNISLRFP